jgi:hypothetical protein
MRTTIDLDDDLVVVAKELAGRRGMTMGQIVSDMFRKSLEPSASSRVRNGVPLFVPKKGAAKPSMALVNRLLDGE